MINFDGFSDIARGLTTDNSISYSPNNTNRYDYEVLYNDSGMGKKIVDTLVGDMLRNSFYVEGDTENERIKYLQSLKFDYYLKKALTVSLVYGGSIIFVIYEDGKDPSEPVVNKEKIKGFRVFSSEELQIDKPNDDIYSEDYGEPEIFRVNQTNIHISRCMVFKGEEIMSINHRSDRDKFFGNSFLRPLVNTILEYEMVIVALGHVIKKMNMQVLKTTNLAGQLTSKDGNERVRERLKLFNMNKSIANTILVDMNEEEVHTLNSSSAGLDKYIEKIQENLSSVSGIPLSILMGKQLTGLNSSGQGEIRIYYDRIKYKQETLLKPALTKVIDGNIIFNSLWQMSDMEKTELRKIQADIDQIYYDLGVYSEEDIAKSRFGGDVYSTETEL
jgi:phage-related protein (TIGR01555 family)